MSAEINASKTALPFAGTLQPDSGGLLSDENFERLAVFIYDYCGIRITEKKRTMIDGRLRKRMRMLGIANINSYCDFLFANDDAATGSEIVHFIDAVTTNKTDFFRENSHFEYVTETLLPEITDSGRHTIHAWSAACSTGAEPYTMAMVLADFCARKSGIDYSILATDICTEVLNKAVCGRYPLAMADPIPDDVRRRYIMLARDPRVHEFRVKPALRSKVRFSQLNLMDSHYPFERNFDLIFCRNVLIYFDRPTQGQVLARLCTHLRVGGYLILGHSESVSGLNLPLKMVANTIFRRV